MRLEYLCHFSLAALLIIILSFKYSPQDAFALSPSFARQEITDDRNDWKIVQTKYGTSYKISTPDGPRLSEYGQNEIECKRAQSRDNIQKFFHPPDILSVTYLSTGNTLNATLWLSTSFREPPSNASNWLSASSPYTNAPWYQIIYGMSISVDSVYDTEGTDYEILYIWDVSNKTWTKILQEFSPAGEKKILDSEYNYTVFPLKGQKYIDFSVDLATMNYPDRYDILFYSFDYFLENYRICPMSDLTPRTYVPPPDFAISSSPTSVELRAGEQKTIKLQLKSSADIKSQVLFSTNQTDELKSKIKSNIISDRIEVPLNGIVTSNLEIIALENVKPDSYILPIFANINITTEAVPRRSAVTGEMLYNPLPQNLVRKSNLTITVLPPLTIIDYINSLKTLSNPITELITFATALGGVGGFVFGFVKWIRRKKQKEKEYYY